MTVTPDADLTADAELALDALAPEQGSAEAAEIAACPNCGTLATELYIVAYFFIAFGRVYETTVSGTLWRGLGIGLLYGAVLLSVFVAIAAPTLWPLFFGETS